jgi:hypothetical protein
MDKTARLVPHARQRCAEMDVRTKDVKRLMRAPDLVRPAGWADECGGRMVACSDEYPDIAVVYSMDGDQPVVITVVPRTYEIYQRAS